MAPRRAPFFRTWNVVLLTLHRQEELVVGLGGFQLVDQELDGGDFVHRVQQLAQDPHALQFVVGSQQLFAGVPERLMLMAGNTRFSAIRRSRGNSMLPVPLNSS